MRHPYEFWWAAPLRWILVAMMMLFAWGAIWGLMDFVRFLWRL